MSSSSSSSSSPVHSPPAHGEGIPSSTSLKREILLLERLLKTEKQQRHQLERQNASLRKAINQQHDFYEEKVQNLEKRLHSMRTKLQKHTSSSEYKAFTLKEAQYQRLVSSEASLRQRIDDRKSELRVLLMELEEKSMLCNSLQEDIRDAQKSMSHLRDESLLSTVPFKNLDTGEESCLSSADPRAIALPEAQQTRRMASRALPPQILLAVFSFLTLNELCSINRCSKTFYELASSDSLWLHFYSLNEYPSVDFSSLTPIQYKLRYMLASHGLLTFLAPIQFYELYSCVTGTMGRYRLRISSLLRQSPYLKAHRIPEKIRISPISNVKRAMQCVAFFHLKYNSPEHYALACPATNIRLIKSAFIHFQFSRHLLEVRTREAYIEDIFTNISEKAYNTALSITQKMRSIEDHVHQFVKGSFESTTGNHVRISRKDSTHESGKNITESYIAEFNKAGDKLSEGIIKMEIALNDLSVSSFSIVGDIIDKYCVENDRSSNLSRSQKALEAALKISIIYLPHCMHDIKTKMDYIHIKKKSSGGEIPCLYLSHELNFFVANAEGRLQARKHYELMATPQHEILFHYRNAFKRKDYLQEEGSVW